MKSFSLTQCSLIRDVAHKRNFYCTNHTTFGPSDNCRGRYLKKEEIPKKIILTGDLRSLPCIILTQLIHSQSVLNISWPHFHKQSAQSETCNWTAWATLCYRWKSSVVRARGCVSKNSLCGTSLIRRLCCSDFNLSIMYINMFRCEV